MQDAICNLSLIKSGSCGLFLVLFNFAILERTLYFLCSLVLQVFLLQSTSYFSGYHVADNANCCERGGFSAQGHSQLQSLRNLPTLDLECICVRHRGLYSCCVAGWLAPKSVRHEAVRHDAMSCRAKLLAISKYYNSLAVKDCFL